MQKRNPIEINIILDGQKLQMRDVSESGIYVNMPKCNLNINQTVKLIIPTSEGDLQLEAGVVRVDEDGAGIAFRNVSKVIKNLCANYEKKNQIVQTA